MALIPVTVPRLRRNHRLTSAMVLPKEVPLAAMPDTKPKRNTKNRKWNVRLSRTVATPNTIMLNRSTRRPPCQSKSRPKKGCVTALAKNPTEAAIESSPRLQPKSVSNGMMKTAKLLRTPLVNRAMNMQVKTIYQP